RGAALVSANRPVVQVAGDPTVDWLVVAFADGALAADQKWVYQRATTGVYAQSGGSVLLTDVLAATLTGAADVVGVTPAPEMLTDPQSTRVTRAFSLWEPFARS